MIDVTYKVFQEKQEFYSSRRKSFLDQVKNKKIVIYGMGAGYHSFNQFVLQRYDLKPCLFIDQKILDDSYDFKFSLESFLKNFKPHLCQDFYILVTIGNRKIYNSIRDNLNKFGFYNVHSVLDVYEYNLCYASKDLEENLHQTFQQNSNNINKAYKKLFDDTSRRIFMNILSGHWHKNPILSSDYSPQDQYIVDDIGLSVSDISLLDCGAYDGDTLIQLCEKYERINLAVALEYDMKNYLKMINKTYPKIDKLIALPLGSADKTGQLFFDEDNKMQSRLLNEKTMSSSMVSVINCDEAFRDIKFTKIIIDTEGYEKQSLIGMRKIIFENTPDIAVAAYHYPTDFFEILNLIDSINPNYKFYLRNHSPFVAETVLYAVKA